MDERNFLYSSSFSLSHLFSYKKKGSADLKAVFGAKKHEITVSTYQMVILLLFNAKDTYSLKELKEVYCFSQISSTLC
jgi:cullin 3